MIVTIINITTIIIKTTMITTTIYYYYHLFFTITIKQSQRPPIPYTPCAVRSALTSHGAAGNEDRNMVLV